MPITSVQYGAVQTAYVGYASYDLDTVSQNLITVWPQPYVTATNILAATTNIVCTATSTTLTFPDANQVALGYNVFIRNDPSSSEDFTVLTNGGTSIQTIAVGETWWIQLTEYTGDTEGTWATIPMGSNTTPIIVNDVAGYGLEVLPTPGTKLSTYTPTKTLTTSSYTVLATDQSSMLLFDGVTNVDLPNLTVTQEAGFYVSFNNISASPVTITGDTGATINGLDDLVVYPNQTGTLVQDASGDWWTLGLGQGFTFAQTIISIDLLANKSGAPLDLTGIQLSNFVIQFYVSDSTPITGVVNIYFGTAPSNWYIQNDCQTTGIGAVNLYAGTIATPLGAGLFCPAEQRIIIYMAPDPLTGILQMYATPTVIDATSILFPPGNATNPSITFTTDSTSGMFLQATDKPAITANSTEVVRFDGSSSGAVQILANPNATGSNFPTYAFTGIPGRAMGMGLSSGASSLDFWFGTKAFSYNSSGFNVLGGLTTLASGGLTVPGNITTTASGTLTVAGLSTLTGGLTTSNDITINSTGNIIGTGGINISGNIQTSGNISITGGGTLSLNTPLSIGNGGTGATDPANAATNILPTVTNPGQFLVWDGTAWASAGDPSGFGTGATLTWNNNTTGSNPKSWNGVVGPTGLGSVFVSAPVLAGGYAGVWQNIGSSLPDGTYTLQLVKSGSSYVYSWV